MANAKQCDRCGVLYDIKYANNVQKGTISGISHEEIYIGLRTMYDHNIDLCPKCRSEFKDWWNEGVPANDTTTQS